MKYSLHEFWCATKNDEVAIDSVAFSPWKCCHIFCLFHETCPFEINVWNITTWQFETSLWCLFYENEMFFCKYLLNLDHWPSLTNSIRNETELESVVTTIKAQNTLNNIVSQVIQTFKPIIQVFSRIFTAHQTIEWEKAMLCNFLICFFFSRQKKDTCVSTSAKLNLRKELKLKDTQNRVKYCLDFGFNEVFYVENVTFLIKFAFTPRVKLFILPLKLLTYIDAM